MSWQRKADGCPWRAPDPDRYGEGVGRWASGDQCRATGAPCRCNQCGIAHFEASMLADELHELAPEKAGGTG